MLFTSRRFFFSACFLVLGFFLLIFYKKDTSSHLKPTVISGLTMGTYYRVSYFSEDVPYSSQEIHKAIQSDLAEVNRQMSTYIEDSEISVVNQAEAGVIHPISPWFAHVLKYSLELAKQSKGAFDPTIGPLVNLWGFGPDGPRQHPSAKQIKETLALVGYDKLKLESLSVSKKNKNSYIDLSSVAKGYAVDILSETMTKLGAKRHLVEIGGELKSKGSKFKNEAWTIGIEHPKKGRKALSFVQLNDTAIASSGNYRNFLETEQGLVYHTIDSKSGKPVVTDLASVTVINKECMKADALATTFVAMGAKRAKEFAREHKIAALFIIKEGDHLKSYATSSFKDKVKGFSFV